MVTESLYSRTRSWAANSETVRRWRERRYRLFLELCDVGPDEAILDVGAGSGAALERFNRTNPIVAVDPEPNTSEWLAAPNVEVRVGDGTKLEFEDDAFGPKRVQRALNNHFSLGWRPKGYWEEINLLSARQLRRLFPDAEIHRERFLDLTKSLMAVRR